MLKKIIISIFLIVVFVGAYIAYDMYQQVYQPNVTLKNATDKYFYVHSDYGFDDIVHNLYEKGYIINRESFEFVSEKKSGFKSNIYSGRYLLEEGMSNNELVDLFRSGETVPVKVTFNNVRTKNDLAGKLSRNLECDSLEILDLINDKEFVAKYGFNQTTILTLFLPNTYQFNWATNADEAIKRMAEEYKKFWTAERKAKAKKLNLSQSEVAILASIVQAEQSIHSDERPKVAGLYINRLRIGMLLQSDPTLVYGLGDFTIRRVLNKHKDVNSRYNTYKYKGLPPGPINLPNIKSLDAVLNYESHSYLYMCAKEDFSGYHNFAKNYKQHLIYARKYQRELNKRRIYN
ncbi:MAG: endolytic transglycosylase MltG [Flavobacteriales bacterium]|nr:endolytic transglycosylase MltG [Flavobacteriales bacterium]